MSVHLVGNLQRIGLPSGICQVFDNRHKFSKERVITLQTNLSQYNAITEYPNLTIFAAGSYARGEASIHSDIDLFFVRCDTGFVERILDINLRQIKVMSSVIDVTENRMRFPPPSNDGQYLKIGSLQNMLSDLGGPNDDHTNAFTARMLMLLESTPIIGALEYDRTIDEIIEAYFRDYADHAEDFRPIFLVNDILRFWKTLCLNYEHRRNKDTETQKVKQKIRNFKLQYSRLMTCFSTVALLCSYKKIDKEDLVGLCKLTPIDRLIKLTERSPSSTEFVKSSLLKYHWFLEKKLARRKRSLKSTLARRIMLLRHSKMQVNLVMTCLE